MNRLQKKCLISAAGVHLLLLVILIVGPAFLSSGDNSDDLQVLEFVPMMTTDKNFSGGGNPKAAPPPPAPVQPTPPQAQPQPPAPPPEPQKAAPPPEPVKNDADAVEPAKERKHKIEVNTRLVSRNDVKTTPKVSAPSAADAQAAAARARAFKAAASQLRAGLSSSTEVDMPGPGGGGPTYARFKDALYTAYMNAWNLPNDLGADAPSVSTRVVVASDGTVISARIIKSSGIPSLDRSVQDALDRVKTVPPLPEGSGSERECNVNFNPLAKQSSG